jgi:hypothetical protein
LFFVNIAVVVNISCFVFNVNVLESPQFFDPLFVFIVDLVRRSLSIGKQRLHVRRRRNSPAAAGSSKRLCSVFAYLGLLVWCSNVGQRGVFITKSRRHASQSRSQEGKEFVVVGGGGGGGCLSQCSTSTSSGQMPIRW